MLDKDSPITQLTDERAAFEAWAKPRMAHKLDRAEGPYSTAYLESSVHWAWLAWQARALLAKAAPDGVKGLGDGR